MVITKKMERREKAMDNFPVGLGIIVAGSILAVFIATGLIVASVINAGA